MPAKTYTERAVKLLDSQDLINDLLEEVCTEAASNGVADYAGQKQELCQDGTTCEQN
jgi:hypothetical protein